MEDAPRTVGPYQVEAILGQGGMGIVYRAVGPRGPVALKVMRPRAQGDALHARFLREAETRVQHPHIAQILDRGTDEEGTPYIAFELLDGRTLAQVFAEGRPPLVQLVEWARQAAEALEAAHGRSIVHRDIKPSNLFICTDGTLRVLDFGVALVANDSATRMTRTGSMLGTVGYLSPEQAEGRSMIDGRADQWALAAVLYEGLAGAPPFVGETPLATIVATLMADLPPLTERAADVPPDIVRLVERALSRAPGARFESMAAFAAGLAKADLSAPGAPGGQPHRASSMRPGERRIVSLLFAVGVRSAEAVEAAVNEERGSFMPLAGDRALGLFGDSVWEGDEVERATRAALTARDAVDYVSVSAGWATSTGRGFSGAALDAAERCVAAKPEGVALNSEAARFLFDTRPSRHLEEGVFELRESSLLPVARGPAHPLLDREAELAQLTADFDAVSGDDRAGVTLIIGPAGIGKSRLLRESPRLIRRAAPDARIGRVSAAAITREADLSLIRGLVEDLAGIARGETAPLPRLREALAEVVEGSRATRGHAEALAELLTATTKEPDSAGVDLVRTRDASRLAFIEWLSALASQGPLVLLLEDLQWADDASLALLEELAEASEDLPLWIVGATRPELTSRKLQPFADMDVRRLRPRGLTRRGMRTLAESVAGRSLGDPLLGRLAEQTSGNPFFVIQSVHAIVEASASDLRLDALPLPSSVEAAVQSRIDHLPDLTREFCREVSIWNRPFTEVEAREVGQVDPMGHLDVLSRRDLLTVRARRAPVTYRLSPLVREVAYRSLGDGAREECHRRAAAHLAEAGVSDPEERARHHEGAGEPESASRSYSDAARVAIHRGDSLTTLRTSQRSLEIGAGEDELFELHMLQVDALRFLGRREEHGAALEGALSTAADDRELARALCERAVWLWRAGRQEAAEPLASDAVAAARRSGDREALVMARGREYLVLSRTGRSADAAAALDEAVGLAAGVGRRLRATALSWRAHHLATSGEVGARVPAYVELVELYDSLGDVRRAAGAQANLADVYNRLGMFEESAAALEAALTDCRRIGNRTMEGYALTNLAFARLGSGDAEVALELLAEAGLIAGETFEAHLALLVDIYRARALLAAASATEAARIADQAAAAAASTAMRELEMNALATSAEAHLRLDDVDKALDRSSRAMTAYDSLPAVEEGEAEAFCARSRALTRAGREDEAAAIDGRGRRRVLEVAQTIRDEELRGRFLETPSVKWLVTRTGTRTSGPDEVGDAAADEAVNGRKARRPNAGGDP